MKLIPIVAIVLLCFSCNRQKTVESKAAVMKENSAMETATFAGGCFWCTEAVFLQLKGVKSINPGYTGGNVANPSYDDVSSGATGHAEAIEIVFDPKVITYQELLDVFFATHDPTSLNQQGADIGTQYRSEIFYHSPAQKKAAEDYLAELRAQYSFGKPVVTAISAAKPFYIAEDYHKNYYNDHKDQAYCQYVITPKVNKVREEFKDKLK